MVRGKILTRFLREYQNGRYDYEGIDVGEGITLEWILEK
jgi:hypothetical protein